MFHDSHSFFRNSLNEGKVWMIFKNFGPIQGIGVGVVQAVTSE